MPTRRLLNRSEAATRRRLFPAAAGNDAEVWSKVRAADVLQINGSGISRTLFDYALRAHFDFVVVDQEWVPLFAMEFDGPHHDGDRRAIENDLKKNELCSKLSQRDGRQDLWVRWPGGEREISTRSSDLRGG